MFTLAINIALGEGGSKIVVLGKEMKNVKSQHKLLDVPVNFNIVTEKGTVLHRTKSPD